MNLSRFFSSSDEARSSSPANQLQKLVAKLGLLIPTLVLLVGIVWGVGLAAMAVRENISFGQTASQWVDLLTAVSDYANKKKDKAVFDLEDVRNAITEAGLPINKNGDVLSLNSFSDSPLRVTMPAINIVRFETILSTRVCRRLSLFLTNGKVSSALNLATIQALGDAKFWKVIYSVGEVSVQNSDQAETACGNGEGVQWAVSIKLK